MELGYKYFLSQTIFKKIIIINIIIFLLPLVANTILFLFNIRPINLISYFDLHPNFGELIKSPWTLLSYSFLHLDFFHIFWNMLILYVVCNHFLNFLSDKRLLEIYFFGALFGGLFFVISYNIFPVFKNSFSPLIGSSAAVYSILIFTCAYMPNTVVNLIFFDLKLKYLGIFYVLLSLIQIPISNSGGNIAHLGGAFYGLYLARNFNGFKSSFSFEIFNKYFKKKSSSKASINNQKKIDSILDKISKSGYESLSKIEKDYLFKNSNKD